MTTSGGGDAKSTEYSPPLMPNRDEIELTLKGQRKTENMYPVKNNMQRTQDKPTDKRQWVFKNLLVKAGLCHSGNESSLSNHLSHPAQGLSSSTAQDRIGIVQGSHYQGQG